MRASRVDIGVDNLQVVLLHHFHSHVGSWVDIAMNLKDIRFAPTYSCKFRLLESLHVTLRTDHMGRQDNDEFRTQRLIEVVAKQMFQDR